MAKRRVGRYPKALNKMAVGRLNQCENIVALSQELGVSQLPRHLTRTLPTASAQVHGFLLKLRRETPSLLVHVAPPFADYARKVSTKSEEDHLGWSRPE